MPTVNDLYQDALVRHATDVEGYEQQQVEEVIAILKKTEADILGQLSERLQRLEGGRRASPREVQRLTTMLQKITDLRNEAWREVNEHLRAELGQFVKEEAAFTREAFTQSLQLQGINLAAPSAAALRAAAFNNPFRLNENDARPLARWLASLRETDKRRLEDAVRIGFLEGQDVNTIVQRVRGTRAARYRDGLLQLTRRQAESVVRTTVNHFANAARSTVWENNTDIIEGLVWTSVLDGRTTAICRARDGKVAPLGDNPIPPGHERLEPPDARPPAHAQCRSILVAMVSPEGVVGKRPFVVDTRTPENRRIDFRARARQQGKTVGQVRNEWARQRVGRAPASTTYQEFLARQDKSFQNDVLGPTRAKLFREGGLSLDDFVTNSGRRYSLSELRRRDADAFRKAGIQ